MKHVDGHIMHSFNTFGAKAGPALSTCEPSTFLGRHNFVQRCKVATRVTIFVTVSRNFVLLIVKKF
jgi:hypothetical protein